MTLTQTRPVILELLSELEKRDKDSKGEVQSGSVVGSTFSDPRGYTIINTTDNEVGKVDDLYVDPHTRIAQFALLSLGNTPFGLANRRILVGFNDLEIVGSKQARVKHIFDKAQ